MNMSDANIGAVSPMNIPPPPTNEERYKTALIDIVSIDVFTESGQQAPDSVMRQIAELALFRQPSPPVIYRSDNPFDVPGYEHLADILQAAYDQSARGKGKERHANASPWHEQRINTIPAGQRSIADGVAYQVQKKALEACDMAERGEYDAAERELLGAIVYAAACIEQVRRAKLKA